MCVWCLVSFLHLRQRNSWTATKQLNEMEIKEACSQTLDQTMKCVSLRCIKHGKRRKACFSSGSAGWAAVAQRCSLAPSLLSAGREQSSTTIDKRSTSSKCWNVRRPNAVILLGANSAANFSRSSGTQWMRSASSSLCAHNFTVAGRRLKLVWFFQLSPKFWL